MCSSVADVVQPLLHPVARHRPGGRNQPALRPLVPDPLHDHRPLREDLPVVELQRRNVALRVHRQEVLARRRPLGLQIDPLQLEGEPALAQRDVRRERAGVRGEVELHPDVLMSGLPKVKPGRQGIVISALDGVHARKDLPSGARMTNDKPFTKAGDFPPEVLKLFDEYVHNVIDRRGFLEGAAKLRGGRRDRGRILEALSRGSPRPSRCAGRQAPQAEKSISVAARLREGARYLVHPPRQERRRLPTILVGTRTGG